MIGEMRLLGGSVTFGGKIAYCQQNGESSSCRTIREAKQSYPAWIQNATVRDNILFGQPWNMDRYWKVIEDACLLRDLEILPDGDLTEVNPSHLHGEIALRLTRPRSGKRVSRLMPNDERAD